mmetsp:Transcript_37496/g.106348  ORF Transcript_37496/g.106348 Transcript_37496/m.106348 type:complete len:292 (-) Transcript_37496:867-1742(-)
MTSPRVARVSLHDPQWCLGLRAALGPQPPDPRAARRRRFCRRHRCHRRCGGGGGGGVSVRLGSISSLTCFVGLLLAIAVAPEPAHSDGLLQSVTTGGPQSLGLEHGLNDVGVDVAPELLDELPHLAVLELVALAAVARLLPLRGAPLHDAAAQPLVGHERGGIQGRAIEGVDGAPLQLLDNDLAVAHLPRARQPHRVRHEVAHQRILELWRLLLPDAHRGAGSILLPLQHQLLVQRHQQPALRDRARAEANRHLDREILAILGPDPELPEKPPARCTVWALLGLPPLASGG